MEQNNLILQIIQNFEHHFNKYDKQKNGLIQLLFQNAGIHSTQFFQSGIFQGYGSDKDKNLNGLSVIQYFDGKNFIGEFKQNQRNGFGYCTFCDKCYYKGMYKHDQKVEDNDLVYQGDWKDDLYYGDGYLKLLCGQIYQGNFDKGHPHGYGKQEFQNGDIYEGEFNYGKRHGKGLFQRLNGEKYEGEFSNNKFHGKGKYTWSNGDFYEGNFKDGSYQIGKMKYNIGVRAQGDFQDINHADFDIETARNQMRVYKSTTMNFN